MAKRRNPADLTLRNLRALRTRFAALHADVRAQQRRLIALERQQGVLRQAFLASRGW